jgi:hypothetical protein
VFLAAWGQTLKIVLFYKKGTFGRKKGTFGRKKGTFGRKKGTFGRKGPAHLPGSAHGAPVLHRAESGAISDNFAPNDSIHFLSYTLIGKIKHNCFNRFTFCNAKGYLL